MTTHSTTAFAILFLTCGLPAAGQSYIVSLIAGGGVLPTPVAAATAAISPRAVTLDHQGNLYFTSANCVFKLDAAGVVTRIAGSSQIEGFGGDGGPAADALLANPSGLAMDAAGNLYIADTNNQRVRKVSAEGVITTIAGSGTATNYGGTGPALSAQFLSPSGLAFDSAGNLYISDVVTGRVRKVTTDGNISTIAGSGEQQTGVTSCGSTVVYAGLATNARICQPAGLAVTASGDVYIGTSYGGLVLKVSASNGLISIAAGTINATPWVCKPYSGEGGAATAANLCAPSSLALDSAGILYIGDYNHVLAVRNDGTLRTFAGGVTSGFSGNGGPAASAGLNSITGIAASSSGDLYIADSGNGRVRLVSASTGKIGTVAGTGSSYSWAGEGGLGVDAEFTAAGPLASDAQGNLYIADTGGCRARKLSVDGSISTVAGTGSAGNTGDGGPATAAKVCPAGIALDSAGNVYLSSIYSVRKVAAGNITTVAGGGASGSAGDGGPAISAQLAGPAGLSFDRNGNLYIADRSANRIRRISASNQTIGTVAGTGLYGSSGDGGPATGAQLGAPQGVAVNSSGNLFIADTGNSRIREVDAASSMIATLAGVNPFGGYGGDGGPATSAGLNNPSALAFDSSGNLFIADSKNHAVRKVAGGLIQTIYGTPNSGDVQTVSGLTLDPSGTVYISTKGNGIYALVPPHTRAILSAAVRPNGSFRAGEPASYTITVSNAGEAGPSAGTITVSEIPSAHFNIVSMSGTGWSCTLSACVRSDSLAPGAGYPAIDVAVNLSAGAPAQIPNHVTVAGGAFTTVASDLANVLPAPPLFPAISPGGVVALNSPAAIIQPGSWISIYGHDLANTTAVWNGEFPTQLGGTSVTINNQPAYLWYVSPTQVNLQAPDDPNRGMVTVTLTNGYGTATSSVTLADFGPAFSLLGDGKHAAGVILASAGSGAYGGGTYDLLGPSGGFPFATRPVKAGEPLVLFGVGFGPTAPEVYAGQPFSGAALTTNTVRITIGGVAAQVAYSGLITAGLYQFNLTVPNVSSGDQPLIATVGGVETPPGVLVTVQ